MKIRIGNKVFDSRKHDMAIYSLDDDEKSKVNSMEEVDALIVSPIVDKVVINASNLEGFFRQINQKRKECIKIVEDIISNKDLLYHRLKDLLNVGFDFDNGSPSVFDVINFLSRREIELVEDIRLSHGVDGNSAIFILSELKNRIRESDNEIEKKETTYPTNSCG